MKKAAILILIILVITAITVIYKTTNAPEWVKINAEMVQACTMDMEADTDVVCD